jgi:putative flippase GtrA
MQQRVKDRIDRLVKYEKVRFGLVGIINTLVDFGVLFLLVDFLNIPPIIANIISTTTALIVSYGLNKKSVFGDDGSHNARQIVSFVIVTLIGLWGLQTVVIFAVSGWLQGFLIKNIALLIAKLIASFFSLVWNYLWYSRIIFKRKSV